MDTNSFHANPDAHKYSSGFFSKTDCFSDRKSRGPLDQTSPLYTDALHQADSRKPCRCCRLHPPIRPRYGCVSHGYYWISAARSTKSRPSRSLKRCGEATGAEIPSISRSG